MFTLLTKIKRSLKNKRFIILGIILIIIITFITTNRTPTQIPQHSRQMIFVTDKDYLVSVDISVPRVKSEANTYLPGRRFLKPFTKIEEEIKNNITFPIRGNKKQPIYILEVRNNMDQLLLSKPVPLMPYGGSIMEFNYQQPNGFFTQEFILPSGSSYIALVERKSGKVLEISYLEDWQPL